MITDNSLITRRYENLLSEVEATSGHKKPELRCACAVGVEDRVCSTWLPRPVVGCCHQVQRLIRVHWK